MRSDGNKRMRKAAQRRTQAQLQPFGINGEFEYPLVRRMTCHRGTTALSRQALRSKHLEEDPVWRRCRQKDRLGMNRQVWENRERKDR